MRTGTQYLESLQDGRQVVIDGEVVRHVASHPAFAGVCRTVAQLYDRIAAERDSMTYPSPKNAAPVAVGHMIPRSIGELRHRRIGLSRIADCTFGLLGRGP